MITIMSIQTYLNITLAIIIGLMVDKVFNKISNKILRIISQFTVNIIIIKYINLIYSSFNLDSINNGVFFVSVFLGSQKFLFNNIHQLI